MSDERFEQKLATELRRIEIPPQLQAQLLELSRQPAGELERANSVAPDTRDRKGLRRQRGWILAITTAGIVAALYCGWSLLNSRSPMQLVDTPSSTSSTLQLEPTTKAAETLAELQRLRSLIQELELAYQQLGQAESSILAFEEAQESGGPELTLDEDILKAETIFWTAETSLFSGYKTDGVRAQLLYVISKFPDSAAAQRAKSLLANF